MRSYFWTIKDNGNIIIVSHFIVLSTLKYSQGSEIKININNTITVFDITYSIKVNNFLTYMEVFFDKYYV